MLGACRAFYLRFVSSRWFDTLSFNPISTWGTSCNDCGYRHALLWSNFTELWLQLLLLWLLSFKIVSHFGNLCRVRKSGKVWFLLTFAELWVLRISMFLSTWKFTCNITEIFFIVRYIHGCIEMPMTSCWGVFWDLKFIFWTFILAYDFQRVKLSPAGLTLFGLYSLPLLFLHFKKTLLIYRVTILYVRFCVCFRMNFFFL